MNGKHLFSTAHLNTLRFHYASLQTIDPCGDSWAALQVQLAKCSPEQLRQLALANIKFVSLEAASQYQALDRPDSKEVYTSAIRNVACRKS